MNIGEFKKAVKSADSVVIYGAGKMARQVAACLRNLEPSVSPFCFAVTQGIESQVDGIDVMPIRQVPDIQARLIIVASARTNHPNMLETLDEIGAAQRLVIDGPSLEALKRESLSTMLYRLGIDFSLLRGMTNDLIPALTMFPDETYNGSIKKKIFEIALQQSAEFAMRDLTRAKMFDNVWSFREWSLKQVSLVGLFLEFGVADGGSLDFYSKLLPNQQFFGFDSFDGLPEAWKSGFEKGRFSQANLPTVPANARLIKGWFEDALPDFVASLGRSCQTVAFIHIDCDLYSSTKCIFDNLGGLFRSGTIIVFDEYMNYPGWMEHEHKAFRELIESRKLSFEYLAFVENGNQVTVRIL